MQRGEIHESFAAKVMRMWSEEAERAKILAKRSEPVDVEAIADWLIKEIMADFPPENR